MNKIADSEPKIAVIGLGYVGLPLALAFAKHFKNVVGFDINSEKVSAIRNGQDPTREGLEPQLKSTSLRATAESNDLKGSNFFVIGVPTPIDQNRNPDLEPLRSSSELVGKILQKGSVVVYESTVYPGVTEDFCGPILERYSGLKRGVDFFLGYSPERINPGDHEHTLETVTKIVAGENGDVLERIAMVYGPVVKAGLHRAPSIKVAEAAKVIENTQRDLNIALMNELAIIFDRMGISTSDVLAAAGTKWNFLKFVPGLVGGHCIGVDPYYLTTKAEQLGYHPQVILSGRRINDDMGRWVAQRVVKEMIHGGTQPKGSRVGILGLTFKENVADIRNSRVPDVAAELKEFGCQVLIHDPLACPAETRHEYGLELTPLEGFTDLDAIILCVAHRAFAKLSPTVLRESIKTGGLLADLKGTFKGVKLPGELRYWGL